MKVMVVGFAHNNRQAVLLISKRKPEWMKGRLNGVGGKVHASELPYQAMVRECNEETGLFITTWNMFCVMQTQDCVVYFYEADIKDSVFKFKQKEKEELCVCSVYTLGTNPVLPNLRWLIPLALDEEIKKPVFVEADICFKR